MKLKNIKHALKHGLFLQEFKKWLGRHVDFRFIPYYLMEERAFPGEPSVKDPQGYEVRILKGGTELQDIVRQNPSVYTASWKERFEKSHLCVALLKSGRLAAYCWADPEEFNFSPRSLSLEAGDAYLYDAFTIDAFRGQGLAPYMRKQCYRILNEQGYDRFYSVSDLSNSSTIKFKKKLHARILRLRLKIDFRGKELCNLAIRNYAGRNKGQP